MAEYLIQDTTLDAIADAINAKTGGSSAMTPAQMVTEIESIQTGGEVEPDEYEYTQAEDWTSDSTGNSDTVYSAYCNSGFGVYFVTFFGNTTSGYYAKEATYIRIPSALLGGYGSIDAPGRFVRYTNVSAAVQSSNNVSFYVKAGTVIKVERYPVFKVLGYE